MSETKTTAKKKEFKFSARSRKNMSGINPLLITLAERALAISSYDFGVLETGGCRTAEQQNEIFNNGYSQLDGYDLISYHQTSNALDLVAYVGGKFTWSNDKAYTAINKAVLQAWKEMNIKGVRLEWGGDWKSFTDKPHYQIRTSR